MSSSPQRPSQGSGDRLRSASDRAKDSARQQTLYTAGELVERGGLGSGLTIMLYIVVGAAFWSLVGWGLDHLLGTQWVVIAGTVFGASAGVYLGYLHLREALKKTSSESEIPSDTKKSSDLGHEPKA